MPNDGGELVLKKYLLASAHRINRITLMCLCSDVSVENARETDKLVYCARMFGRAFDFFTSSDETNAFCQNLRLVEQLASTVAESRSYMMETVS